jgi:hypothetical protein
MKRKQTLVTLALITLVALAMTACEETVNIAASQAPTQVTQQQKPIPTSTPVSTRPLHMAAEALPPTPSLAAAPGPISVSQDKLQAIVAVEAGNVRRGPGLAYPVVGMVAKGDIVTILKRNSAGDWLQIAWESESAWLSVSLVLPGMDVTEVEVAEAIEPPPATPTSIPAATTIVAAPLCQTVPIRGFGTVWGEHEAVAATLGCPLWPYLEEGTNAAVQTFEHGTMLWLAADSNYGSDPVYVLFDTGDYQRFPDLGPADPAVVGTVPEGFHAPGDRFSKVYWEGTGARVRQRLGHAVSPPVESPGAFQQFERGRMFWTEALDRISVLYDYWQWDSKGENGIQVRSWIAFEDSFGD